MAEHAIITEESSQMQLFVQLMEGVLKKLERYCASTQPTLAGEVYLTGEEVCERLKLSARTLQEYRSRGLLAFYKIGGKILYKQSDLQGCLTDIITPFKSHRYDDRRTTARQIGRQTGSDGRHWRLC